MTFVRQWTIEQLICVSDEKKIQSMTSQRPVNEMRVKDIYQYILNNYYSKAFVIGTVVLSKTIDDYYIIIDGQHRLRGIHQNEDMQEIEIPIIIFPKEFNSTNTAKIFAEINTLQKKLDPLHELFMQHKFCIDHVNIKRKFIDYHVLLIDVLETQFPFFRSIIRNN